MTTLEIGLLALIGAQSTWLIGSAWWDYRIWKKLRNN